MASQNVIDHEKLAKNWLVGGLAAAIIFIAFLVWSDNYLTNSDKELQLKNMLLEMREAQTSMPARPHLGR